MKLSYSESRSIIWSIIKGKTNGQTNRFLATLNTMIAEGDSGHHPEAVAAAYAWNNTENVECFSYLSH